MHSPSTRDAMAAAYYIDDNIGKRGCLHGLQSACFPEGDEPPEPDCVRRASKAFAHRRRTPPLSHGRHELAECLPCAFRWRRYLLADRLAVGEGRGQGEGPEAQLPLMYSYV